MDHSSEDQSLIKSRHAVNDEDDSDESQSVATHVEKDGAADDEDESSVKIPDVLPLLPVRGVVAFPGTIMPLTVGRTKSKALLDSVLTGDKLVTIVSQRFVETEDPLLFDLYRVGTVARILKLLHMPDGTESIVIHGLQRAGVVDLVQTEPFLKANIQQREDESDDSHEIEALVHSVRTSAVRIIELSDDIPNEAAAVLANIESPGGLADFLASNIQLDLVKKQELLETFDVEDRLNKVHKMLVQQVEMLELSDQIQSRVRGEIDKSQRRYYLQEQMRAIQEELGEGDTRSLEVERLRQRIKDAQLPEGVAKEAERELNRLEQIPQASPEYSVSLDYLNWLADLPWSKSTEDSLSIPEAEAILNADHFGLDKVKKRILEFLAVRMLRPEGRGPILCLAGPPGVGKTSLGQSIARAMNRKFIRMSLGGMRDEAEIRGHRRTYIGAIPGRIIQEIRKAGSNNPVFMLDEIDKLGSDFRGDPASAMLEVLDPQQNFSFSDHYLDVPFDLSKVMFICTANYKDPIPGPLRDRMEIIDIPGYTRQEKLEIAKRYLVPRQSEAHGLGGEQLTFDDAAVRLIIKSYTHEAGVRDLEREIAAVCRGVAAKVARKEIDSAHITAAALSDYLGPVQHESEVAMRTAVPGVVTGLAYTPVGGDIIFIEATQMPGRGSLTLTGQLGDVMRESATAAFSVVRSRAKKLKIPNSRFFENDLHVHVPAGAIPKDGPSAGVAMYVSLVSLLKDKPVGPLIAMTGEITLRGLVLPVGGIKEKVLAAHQAGIEIVILPKRNEKDLVDVPKVARDELDFYFAETVDDVLDIALAPPKKKRRKAAEAEKHRARAKAAKKKKPASKSSKKTAGRAKKAKKKSSTKAAKTSAKKKTAKKKTKASAKRKAPARRKAKRGSGSGGAGSPRTLRTKATGSKARRAARSAR